MYLLAFILVVLVWCYQRYASTNYLRDVTNNIPGPYVIPLVGCLKELVKLQPKNVLQNARALHHKYGNVLRLWGLNRLLILSCDTEFNEQVLSSNTHITKIDSYGLLHKWIGVGLLTSDGKKWHSRRKIITPAFHFKILEEFLEVFDRQATILLQCLEAKADGRTAFDIYPFLCLFTLDVIVETAMGTKVNAQTNKELEYSSAVREMTALMAKRFTSMYIRSEVVFTILKPSLKMRQTKLIQIMHKFTKGVIEERRIALQKSLREKSSTTIADNIDVGTKKRLALLDVLLQSTIDGEPLTDEDIREEVDTFMFEGHDTTASALSFALHLLARHLKVQQKIVDEIYEIYGKKETNGIPFSLANLKDMKYLECAIKESLRLYPPVPIFGRQFKHDFKYTHSKLGNGIIPAGAELYIGMGNTLRQPELYTNPDEFIPERHLNADEKFSLSASPFSAGPRNCIGQKFAMNEMKVAIIRILRMYELLPLGSDVSLVTNIVLCSATGMQLGMKKRS
ncbi:cytochrome P450 4d8-like [Haematobia irritans]|uniref:cytochrome P450 4d8-like n=1 Tax=Haematobia irritans TaxID=7368 RepID=UPI003F4F4B26